MLGWSARPGLAIAVVTCLIVGSLGLVAGSSATIRPATTEPRVSGLVGHPVTSQTRVPSSSVSASPTIGSHAVKGLAIANGVRARENPTARAHLPDPRRKAPNQPGPIQPVSTQAPAPMGVADIGLRNESGVLVPYELNTTSVAGTVDITNLQSIYVDGDGPDTYGIQLNSVVNGVTIFGNSSYEFWTQNYGIYSIGTQQLTFGDEVWNFSNPATSFPQNSIYFGSNGTYEATPFPPIWQGFGPTFTIGYPFTLTLYSNTSVIDDRAALYFNYTLSNSTFRLSASYDDLIFNSTVGTPTRAAPLPYYQADGYQYDPVGLINDMEIDILGNDDGDTTTFTAADATVSLQYWNATASAMQEVPSAFNAGQETAETSVGLAVYSSGGPNPVAIVRPGPSLVGGLWNYSAQNGAVADSVTVYPRGVLLPVCQCRELGERERGPMGADVHDRHHDVLPTGGQHLLPRVHDEQLRPRDAGGDSDPFRDPHARLPCAGPDDRHLHSSLRVHQRRACVHLLGGRGHGGESVHSAERPIRVARSPVRDVERLPVSSVPGSLDCGDQCVRRSDAPVV